MSAIATRRAAADALASTSIDGLLSAIKRLTHEVHDADAARSANLRAERSMVEAEMRRRVTVEPVPNLPIKVRCIYKRCCDQTLALPNWAACEAWFDEHAREVAHDARWPITYTIGYAGREPSGHDGVAYREPIMVLS